MQYRPSPHVTILTPPADGSWNLLMDELATVVDARPLGHRPTDPDLGVAARMAVTASQRTPRLEVGLAPRSESNLYAGFDRIEGVYVATWDELAVGVEVEVLMHLPGGERVSTLGRVEWTRAACDAGGPGVGVRFVGLNERGARLLARFAAKREPGFFV